MNPVEEFFRERRDAIEKMSNDDELKRKSLDWMLASNKYQYSYNYTWMGRPIIKFPTDILAAQEIIWRVKPDLIIETGIAHGGSIVFSAAMLELLGGDGRVIGIDLDIRAHNRTLIESHPMFKRIDLVEGSSIEPATVAAVQSLAAGRSNIMVFLDSLHTHRHVAAELQIYAPMVSVGSYLVLADTFIEYFPKGYYAHNRPWDVGNNPMTALREFMNDNDDFEIDQDFNNKLMITEAIDGYLRRIKRS